MNSIHRERNKDPTKTLGRNFIGKMLPFVFLLVLISVIFSLSRNSIIKSIPIVVLVQLTTIFILGYILRNSYVELNRVETKHKLELERRSDYEKLFNLSSDMICMATFDGHFKQVNSAFERILGYSSKDLLERPFLEFVHPDDYERTKEEFEKLIMGIGSVDFENRYLSKDGTYKVLGWTSSVMKDEGIIFAAARDLTKMKHANEEMRKAYDFVEAILDNVPNMIFVKDAQDLKFLKFNKAGEELLGFKKEDLLGKNDYDFFPKNEADFFTSKDQEVLKGKKVFEIPEETIQTKDKGSRVLRTKKIPVFNADGSPRYLVGISEDITEFKKINEERTRNEFALKRASLINGLIRYSLDGVVGMNVEGVITSWNSQAEKIFGWSEAEALGKDLASLIIPHEYREAHSIGLKKFLLTGIGPILNTRIELVGLRKGEVVFPIELTVIPIPDNHGWLFYAYVRDISDRKIIEQHQKNLLQQEHLAREAAEQSVAMRDDFLSIAAHELKTPLTPISMQLQLLERSLNKVTSTDSFSINKNLLEITKNSKKEVDRLARLIDELLDVSRISAGRLTLHKRKTILNDLIKQVIDRHLNLNVKVVNGIHLDVKEGLTGYWDASRLESVIENLVTNAIKYGEGKPIEIKAWQSGDTVIILVKDQGIGICDEDQKKIFQKFERAVSVKKFSGLGLGLYISRKIVEAHGGVIKLASKVGHGSTFRIELPIERYEETNPDPLSIST